MQTKLTLRLDDALIRRAKLYAGRAGKSVSEIVADYFARLEAPAEESARLVRAKSPAVESLVGVISDARLDERDYRDHLADRHR